MKIAVKRLPDLVYDFSDHYYIHPLQIISKEQEMAFNNMGFTILELEDIDAKGYLKRALDSARLQDEIANICSSYKKRKNKK